MCTADIAQRWNLTSDNLAPPTRAARFAMKLPRCEATDASAVSNTRSRNHDGRAAALRASAARGHACPSSGVRRCQSTAAARRPRVAASGTTAPSVQKSRSCSQEPASSCQSRCPPRSKVLPVPPYEGGRDRFSSSHSVDKKDLARMYDYATWNMYERIVSARRRRLSQMSSERPPATEQQRPAGQRASEPASSRAPARHGSNGNRQQQPLYKASSQDESTAATIDETDKSSTTSSSWSRTDSPGTFPGLAFPMPDTRDVKSCPPPALEGGENGEDQFIFQLDL